MNEFLHLLSLEFLRASYVYPYYIYTTFSFLFFFIIYLFIHLVFCLFRAPSAAYADPQARGPIVAVAAGLGQSHRNARSGLCL